MTPPKTAAQVAFFTYLPEGEGKEEEWDNLDETEKQTWKDVADAVIAHHESCKVGAIEIAWGIIANAGSGDWDKESPEWVEAATRWRDEHVNKMYADKAKLPAPPP